MPGVPVDSTNLVVRALDLVREKTGNADKKFKINLQKECPAQAGLGGGSGNAATAMWGVNELLGRPATLSQLVEWSGELGSDITFFLSEGTAYCTGRGEIMEDVVVNNGEGKVTIVKIDEGLSTPKVFKNLEYDKLSAVDPIELLESFKTKGPFAVPTSSFVNDLQPPAFKCLPRLQALYDDLLNCGFDVVLMSGSGTSIFCLGEGGGGSWEEIKGRDDLKVWETEFVGRKEGEWYRSKA
ncbi:hypothetical protein TrRE_jg6102 [Triparma retinervis]|uniref:4-(cytidine 5'-diphospho)-2-C-methyl-D-erythritol kinase n=1 Tax=Triparma retinervis TaxID=2557542 RepID=A0A9W6Z3B4_9STRA|nr:hypothetical protein TrRE_jg6102 [Triparma retinervis]